MTNIPFSKGDWVIDLNNPSQPGQYTGTHHPAGPHIMSQFSFQPVYRFPRSRSNYREADTMPEEIWKPQRIIAEAPSKDQC